MNIKLEHQPNLNEVDQAPPEDNQIEIDSVTLARLIGEVKLEEAVIERSYNRTYNRHNR
jgi:hypothetical protein